MRFFLTTIYSTRIPWHFSVCHLQHVLSKRNLKQGAHIHQPTGTKLLIGGERRKNKVKQQKSASEASRVVD